MNLKKIFLPLIAVAIISPLNSYADKVRDETYCYYSGFPIPDDMSKKNKKMCYKYWDKKGYIGGRTVISHSYSQKDLTGEKGEKLISQLIERDKQAIKDLNKRLSQKQTKAKTPCTDVMQSFMKKRNYLSNPKLMTEQELNGVYYCNIQYLKDNVEYSLPILVQITYNPSTGTYKYKSL